MTLRSPRERVIQTLCFEFGGLCMVTPIYMILFGRSAEEGLFLMVALSLGVMLWSSLFNFGFDWLEWSLTKRVASDRPHDLRLLHAVLHEGTFVIVTLPMIMVISDLSFGAALALDLGLTLFYAGYAYVFYLIYDHFRPVRARPQVRERHATY